jgi:tRNA (guanine37-N1)-methyltransferase
MRLKILTLFPKIIDGYFSSSIMAKAVEKKKIDFEIIDIRQYTRDKHKSCDDYPYGGGPGMVLKFQPLYEALTAHKGEKSRIVYPTPSGKLFDQKYAEKLTDENELIFICGRYEGIDQRIIDMFVDDEISINDYVLSSGEVAVLVIIDALYRLIEGVINRDSLMEESFTAGLLEYPHYTRPEDFKGMRVPDILLSGHHANIERWRKKKSIEKTLKFRPELIEKIQLSDLDKQLLIEIKEEGDTNGFN